MFTVLLRGRPISMETVRAGSYMSRWRYAVKQAAKKKRSIKKETPRPSRKVFLARMKLGKQRAILRRKRGGAGAE